jgi:hypothetical protein
MAKGEFGAPLPGRGTLMGADVAEVGDVSAGMLPRRPLSPASACCLGGTGT